MARLALTASTMWLGPTAAWVSGGVPTRVLAKVIPPKLLPTLAVSRLRASSGSRRGRVAGGRGRPDGRRENRERKRPMRGLLHCDAGWLPGFGSEWGSGSRGAVPPCRPQGECRPGLVALGD